MKNYIKINLNKAESSEVVKERVLERTRWVVFGVLIFSLLFINVRVWMIGFGYNSVIQKKKDQIKDLENQIKQLQSKGKNLSKNDIMSFADLEQDRFLWARNMELLGQMTPDDMAITGMKFKRDKLTIKGIGLTFEDRKDFEIIDEYVQTLRDNKEFSQNFSRIKYVGHQKISVRGQNIIRFEIIASIKKGGKKFIPRVVMAEKRNIILFGAIIILTLSYWVSSAFFIGDKPFEIKLLEQEETELNENLISAQILASKLDRVYTLFQENLALSQQDSLAEDASLPFLNSLTDILDDLDIQLLGIKPKDRESKGDYYKSPYVITVECTYDEFGKFLAEIERSPRLITLNEYEVKNGIERVKTNVSEDDLLEQVFELNLATITLVKSRSKG